MAYLSFLKIFRYFQIFGFAFQLIRRNAPVTEKRKDFPIYVTKILKPKAI